MKIKKIAVALIIAVVAGVVGVIWVGQIQPNKYTGNIEKVRLGVYLGEFSSLIYIAQHQNFFKGYGLDVTLTERETGVLTTNDLFSDRVDVAMGGEFVFVPLSFQRSDFKILGAIATTNSLEVIARKDRGIGQPSDLKGKKIGVSRRTQADFFLGSFLSFNGILSKEITTVDLKPSALVEAIVNGDIDAAINFQPFAHLTRKRLGINGIAWPGQNGRDYYLLIVSSDRFVSTHPQIVERLLKALLEAEDFVQRDPAAAQAIVEQSLHLDHDIVSSTWAKTDFRLRLDQDLLILMEDEAKWFMQNKFTDKTTLPNYLDFIYMVGLEKVAPVAVTIIH